MMSWRDSGRNYSQSWRATISWRVPNRKPSRSGGWKPTFNGEMLVHFERSPKAVRKAFSISRASMPLAAQLSYKYRKNSCSVLKTCFQATKASESTTLSDIRSTPIALPRTTSLSDQFNSLNADASKPFSREFFESNTRERIKL